MASSAVVCALLLFLAFELAPSSLQARILHTEARLHPHYPPLTTRRPSSPILYLGFLPQFHTPSLPQVQNSHDPNSVDKIVQLFKPESEASRVHTALLEAGSTSSLQDQSALSSIPSLLKQNGLPVGLLPASVASYSITEDGDFIVCLQEACYVDFDHKVYYAQTITGKLSYGSITNLTGIQAKEAFFWVPVSAIRTDIPSSEFIYFNIGPISKKLPISQFETIPTCKAKSMPF